jgi:ubiquitin carboxyl-terminal hydrolase 4/11/15
MLLQHEKTTEHSSYLELACNDNDNGEYSSARDLTLEKCFLEHTREEVLDEANAWYCNICKKHKCAKKNVKFWAHSLPQILVIVLKRFEISGRHGMVYREKIETPVEFPIAGLDLSKFCYQNKKLSSAQLSASTSTNNTDSMSISSSSNNNNGYTSHNNNDQNKKSNNENLYDLFAVCNHYGRMGFGHYSAYARDWKGDELSNTWYSFDDDVVEICQEDDVISRAAYILFYRRRPGV